MSWREKVQQLSHRQLKEIAGLCAGAAFLIAIVLVLSGSVPFAPSWLKLAVRNINQTAATANAAAIPYWSTPYTSYGGYPNPLLEPGYVSAAVPGSYGCADHWCSQSVTCNNPYIAVISAGDSGGLSGGAARTQRSGATTQSGTGVALPGGSIRLDWACQPYTSQHYVNNTVNYCPDAGYAYQYYATNARVTAPAPDNSIIYDGTTLIGTATVVVPGNVGDPPKNYTLTCSSGGSTWVAVVPVTLTTATLSMTANPPSVAAGGTSVLTYAVTNASQCLITSPNGLIGAQGLGTDSSGNGNSWSLNNITMGDQTADTPTDNFATLNQAYYYSPNWSKGTVQAGGLAAYGGWGAVAGWQLTAGKWYWEYVPQTGSVTSGHPIVGVFEDPSSNYSYRAYPGHNNDTGIGYGSDGKTYYNSYTTQTPALATFADGDIIGVAYDADTGKVYFSKNGVWQNSGNPAAGTGYVSIVKNGWPGLASYYGSTAVNFGQGGSPVTKTFSASATYTVPASYSSLTITVNGGGSGGPGTCDDGGLPPGSAGDPSSFNSATPVVAGSDISVTKTWNWAGAGAPVGGSAVSFVVGAGGAGGSCNGAGISGVDGAAGSVTVKSYAPPTYYSSTGGNYFYPPPTGFKALSTDNLPAVALAQPSQYFNATTYTGNGAAQTVNTGFQPDLVWIKNRVATYFNTLTDSTRGPNSDLFSNSTGGASANDPNGWVSALNALTFTVGGQCTATPGNTNLAGNNYVAWAWKKSPTSGVDIVTYTGNGAASRSISHALGTAPDFVMVKRSSGAGNWYVWVSGLTDQSYYLKLNTADAASNSNSPWGTGSSGNFTSSVFTVGDNSTNNLNVSGASYVAYLFSNRDQFQKTGAYVGNGSADGPFVYTGFKPKYVMIKDVTTGSYNWITVDSTRSPANAADLKLSPQSSATENDTTATGGAGTNSIDFLANGFKLRTGDTYTNANTDTYIYTAFADVPFKSASTPNGYTVSNSLRFDASNRDYLSRTPTAAGNRKTFTFSTWLKRGALSTNHQMLLSSPGRNDFVSFYWNCSADQLDIRLIASRDLCSSYVFRDPSHWYHVVISVDTTQPNQSDRIKLYVDGVQSTLTGTLPNLNETTVYWNVANQEHDIGRSIYDNAYFFDGNLADFYFVDGTALTPSSFAAADSSGYWKPKAYAGTYGTNGFYLNFGSSLAPGADTSGRGNNFTAGNLSAADQTIDTPTSNFATLNQIYSYSTKATVQAGGLSVYGGYGGYPGWQLNSGKWYWEVTPINGADNSNTINGVGKDPNSGVSYHYYPGHTNDFGFGYAANGYIYSNAVVQPSITSSYAAGDVIGVAYDADTGKVYFSKNGQWQNGNNLIPQMTAATTNGVTMSASTIWNSTYDAWKAADRQTNSTSWQPAAVPSVSAPQWLRTDFGLGNAKTVASYSIKNYYGGLGYDPINFTFEGSNNASTCTAAGTTWTVLDTETNVPWQQVNQAQLFTVQTPGSYRCYRVKVTGAGTVTAPTYYLIINELGLYTTGSFSPTDGSVLPVGTVTGGWPGFMNYSYKSAISFGQGGGQTTTFADSSSYNRVMSIVGLAQPSSNVYKFGPASGYFNNSVVNGAVTTPQTPGLNQSGNYTIDLWAYPTSLGTSGGLISRDSGNGVSPYMIYQNGNTFVFYGSTNGSGWDIASAQSMCTGVVVNTWYHLAVTRSGSTYRTFCNGTQTATWTSAGTPIASPFPLVIGRQYQGGAYYNGYLDEVRLSNNARWTANFTPPTSAYTSDANTLLLLHMDDGKSNFYRGGAGGYFAYPPPSGYQALSTGNLPTPTIAQPNNYFDAKTYTGNAGVPSLDAGTAGAYITLSNGNYDAVSSTNCCWLNGEIYSTNTFSSGKWYAEFKIGAAHSAYVGIGDSSKRNNFEAPLGYYPGEYAYSPANTSLLNNNVPITGQPGMSAGDIVMVAVDMDAGKIWFGKNGAWLGTGNPGTGANPQYSGLTGTKAFGASILAGDGAVQANFGQAGRSGTSLYSSAGGYFWYQPPTGFLALPTASSQDISLNFQPDLVWIKNRITTNWHTLVDSSRGIGLDLFSNSTGAQTQNDINGSVLGLNVSSFTVGGSCAAPAGNVNSTGNTYVAWAWKKSPVAGTDIVSYNGNGAATQSIAHSLSTVPDLILAKRTDSTGDWYVWNSALGGGNFLKLNTTGAATAVDSPFSADLIPIMTAATTNGVTMSASAEYQPAWRAGNKSGANSFWDGYNGTTPSVANPQWLKIDFGAGNAKTVASYSIKNYYGGLGYDPINFTFEGSNDNSAWTVLDTQTSVDWTVYETKTFAVPAGSQASYRYYRIKITDVTGGTTAEAIIEELNLWAVGTVPTATQFPVTSINGAGALNAIPYGADAIPTMAGATTGGVTMSAASQWSGSNAPWYAGDKNINTIWDSAAAPSVASPQWLQADFGAGGQKTIAAYSITNYNSGSRIYDPLDFTLEGYAGAATWNILDAQTGISWFSAAEVKTFLMSTTTQGSYRYYRLNVTRNGGSSNQLVISEFNLYPASGGTSQYIAYLFSNREGFQKSGTYVSNASADGPFVYTGFKPEFVMVKNTNTNNASTNWTIFDSARDTTSPPIKTLFANLGVAEGGGSDCNNVSCPVDFLANGFKVRNAYWNVNYGSPDTYLYTAFADVPFKSASTANGYTIPNSLRFDASNSDYLSRTPTAAGNQKTFTISTWVKRGALSTNHQMLLSSPGRNDFVSFYWNCSADQLDIRLIASRDLCSSYVFRDPSHWYHVVISVDTTQSVASKRVVLYVDGVKTSLTGTLPNLNETTVNWNTAGIEENIGRSIYDNAYFFDGNLADFYFVDGTALAPSSFGAADSNGYWKPKLYTGVYGANGFHLDFAHMDYTNFGTSGTVSVGPLQQTTTYTLMCTPDDAPAARVSASATVTVNSDTTLGLTVCNQDGSFCSTKASNPAPVTLNDTADISWYSTGMDANSCAVTDDLSPQNTVGTGNNQTTITTAGITQNTGYTLQCTLGIGTDLAGGNTLSLINYPTAVAGKIGQALSFSSTSQQYATALTIDIPTDVTVSAWVYSSNFAQYGFVAGKYPVNTQWELFFVSNNRLYWRGGSTVAIYCAAPSINQWHHVVGTQTGTTATLYIDNMLCNTGAVDAIGNGSGAITIGKYNNNNYFDGSIDDVRIYNTALAASDVSTLYNLGDVPAGLVGYWPLDATIFSKTASVVVNNTCISGVGDAPNTCPSQCVFNTSTAQPTFAGGATLSWCCPSSPSAGANFTTGGLVAGSKLVTPQSTTAYTLSCPSGQSTITLTPINLPPPPNPSTMTLTATRVKRGNPSTLSWGVPGMVTGISCDITPAPAGSQPSWDGTSDPFVGSTQTVDITAPTRYTLTCGNGTASSSVSAVVSLVPVFKEI